MARNAGRKTEPEDEDSETRSSGTSAYEVYRFRDLKQVNVLLHGVSPDDVEATIEGIVSADRRAELQKIAQDLRNGFFEVVRDSNTEGAYLDPVNDALKALHRNNLCILREANWNLALKPVAQSLFKVNVPTPPQDLSTENPRSDDCSPVRTPRPDISMGISKEALICALSTQGLDMGVATDFINSLQTEMVQHEPLPLEPTEIGSNFTFPFAVIEGTTSHYTERPMFESENQAAGAMACAHNLLLHLDRMANGYSQPRVLFSFTIQGPIIELWAHWTDVKYGKRTFESKVWDCWNVLNPERADDFIEKLNAVCAWGTGQFMESVVEQLRKIADGNPKIEDEKEEEDEEEASRAKPAQSTRRNRKGAEAEDSAQAGVGRF